MSIPLVCHSVGDTEAVMETALRLLGKTTEDIYFLTVG